MPSSRSTRCESSVAARPVAGTRSRVCAETLRRYPTPLQSSTTWSARREATSPLIESIIAGGFCAEARTPSARGRPERARLGRAAPVGVADGNGERVGGVVGRRRRLKPEQRGHHPLYLLLACGSRAADCELDLLGGVSEARHVARARGGEHGSACLADRERRPNVAAEVDVLDRDRVGAVLAQELVELRGDRRQAPLERLGRP